MRKTKIVCTIGPATDDENIMRELMLAGMNVARFNFSHGDYETHEKRLRQIERLRKELDLPVATLLDTKGPEIRLGRFVDDKPVEIKDGDVSGTVKVDKKSGDVEDGKLYARFVTNFKRADGTTYSLAVAYQIVDGEVEVPSYDTVDEITEMFVIILNARNSSAAWAQNAVDVDGKTATQIL